MSVLSATRAAVGSSRVSLRHLRIERGTFALAFVVVGASCLIFAAMPRAFAGFADRALRHEIAAASPSERGVRVSQAARIPAGPAADPLSRVVGRGRAELARLPAPLPALVGSSTTVVETPRLVVSGGLPPLPRTTRYLTLRALPGAGGRLTVLAGRLPRAAAATAAGRTGAGEQVRVPVLEVALSRSTAAALHARLGDRFASTPDADDLLVRSVPGASRRPVVTEVVGIVQVTRPQEPFWFGDAKSARPTVTQSVDLEHRFVFAYGLVAGDAYGALLRAAAPAPLRYEWRFATEPERFDAGDADSIASAAAAVDARAASAGALEQSAATGLRRVVAGYLADRSQAETLLGIAAIGLLACAIAAIGLVATLGAQRRRFAVELLRTRGGSRPQIVAGQVVEGAVLAAPAAGVGLAAALLLTRGGGLRLAGMLATGIALATVGAFAAGAFALARRRLETSPRDEVVLPRLSPRRLVLEGLVVVAAAIGVVLLRRRGIESDGTRFDPYLAAVPVLLGLAAALAALRIYPLPLLALARAAARRRGVVPLLALARAARAPAVGALPLVALILSLAIACFSAIVLRSVSAGQDLHAWRQVGADVRVDTGTRGLPAGLAERLDATAAARAYASGTFLATGAGSRPGPSLLAVEPAAYREVLAAGPEAGAGRLLGGLGNRGGEDLAAVATGAWSYGDPVVVRLGGHELRLHVVASRRSFPSAPPDTATAVVSLPALQRALGARAVAPNRLYANGARAIALPGARVVARADVLHRVRSAPFVEGATRGLRAAIALAAAYAALVVLLSVVLTARSRSRDLAYLATLGLSSRQATALAAGELAPLAVVSAVGGTALGVGIALLVVPGIDLSFFTGGPAPLTLPAGFLAALAGGLLVLVALSALVAAALARRIDPGRILRIGENRAS